MGKNFIAAFTGSSTFDPVTMSTPLEALDKALTYIKNVMVSCAGEVSVAAGVVTWSGPISIMFTCDAGEAVHNTIVAGSITLAAGEYIFVDLNDTDGTVLTLQSATFAAGASPLLGINRLVLGYYDSTGGFFPASLQAALGATSSGGGASAFTHLSDVPSSYTGQAGEMVVVNPGATGLVFSPRGYDVGFYKESSLAASEVILLLPFTRSVTFPANLSGSQLVATVAATAATVFTVNKNGGAVGTVTVAAGATAATFATTGGAAFSLAPGDVLEIVAPATPDSTLANLSLLLAGTRTA